MKVLIADDDLLSRRMLEGILKGLGYDVIAVSNGDAAWEQLCGSEPPEMAILDWVMPGVNGKDLCHEVRKQTLGRYIYLILVTAKSEKNEIIQGLEAGADDYLSKPYDPQELKARLITGRRILELQDQLIEAQEKLRFQATRDALTQLLNYRALMEILDREIIRSYRTKEPLTLILIDLDHFKNVNDTYGHLVGDAVLREASERMLKVIRPYDYLGRYGGEEFLVILANCDEVAAKKVAERIREKISATPFKIEEKSINVTASFGGKTYCTSKSIDQRFLLQEADIALYRAKNSGRNRVIFAENFPEEDSNCSIIQMEQLTGLS